MATAGALIGALRVTLGLDSAQFESGAKKARAKAKTEVSAIQREFDRLKGAGKALAGIWASSEIVAAGKRALDYASSLGEVAQQLGVSTRDLQSYRYAASQAGISQEEMDKSLAKLTRTMGDAKAGGKAQVAIFKELGPAVEGAVVAGRSAGEVIPLIADALAKVKDPATRARVEVDLFGKAGQKLDTLLAGGSQGVNELTQAAQRLGIVLSDDQIQKADDTADKLAAVKMVLESRIAGVVSDNADAILKIGDALGYAAGQVGQFFKNMQGVDRLKRDQGQLSAFFSGWSEQATASDPVKYLQMRTGNLARATADRKKAEASSGGKDYFGFSAQAVKEAKANEAEALRLVRAAKSDPALQAAIERERSRNGGSTAPSSLGTLSSPGGAGGKKGATGPTASDRAENYQQELSDLAAEQLGLQQNITSDVRERARLEHERINTQAAAYDFDLDTKVKAGQLNAADAEKLKLSNDRNRMLQATAVNWQLDDDLTQQELELSRSSLQNQIEVLSGSSNLARTAEERRQIELKILNAQFEIYRLELEAIKAKHSTTDSEYQIAQAKLDQLASVKGSAVASVNRQNMGPLGTYLDSIPRTAAETNEAFEQIAANGLANMNDQLAQAAANTLKLKGIAGQLFNQLIADIIKLNMQQSMGGGGGLFGGILKMGTSLLGGGASAAMSGGLSTAYSNIDSLSGGVGSIRLPGLATGGRIGGFGGTDNNVLSINGIPRARVSANERIKVEPNAADRVGGGIHVEVVEGALFRPVVTQISSGVAAPMSTRAAMGGSAMAQSSIARKGRRRIPGA